MASSLRPSVPLNDGNSSRDELYVVTKLWNADLDHPTVTAVAESDGRTPAQVLIRWHIQLGNIVIPKSVNPKRIASNFDVFDFDSAARTRRQSLRSTTKNSSVLIHEPSTSQAGK